MTTLNAKANNAYHAMIDEYEREHPDQPWLGFDHQRDAWEDGYVEGAQDTVARAITVLEGFRDQAITAERKDAYQNAINILRELS